MEEIKNDNLDRKPLLLLFPVLHRVDRIEESRSFSHLHTDSSMKSSVLLIYLFKHSSVQCSVKLFCLPYYT